MRTGSGTFSRDVGEEGSRESGLQPWLRQRSHQGVQEQP